MRRLKVLVEFYATHKHLSPQQHFASYRFWLSYGNCWWKVLTGDLGLISNTKFKKFVSKVPKYREHVDLSWQEAKTKIIVGLNEYINNFLLIKALAFVTFINGKTE